MNALSVAFALSLLAAPPGNFPLAAKNMTSLTNESVEYKVPDAHHVVLKAGDVTAVVVDNEAVDVPELPEHRAGYNGLASLTHAKQSRNLFVPAYAGLNFEHIHDGSAASILKEKFEPRRSPMQLRVIDERTVELYQPPTTNWKLESCGRYRLLDDGTIEYTFECVPRADVFQKGFIGLFWASYIHEPEDRAIYFRGRDKAAPSGSEWIKAVTPRHGVDSTHPPAVSSMLPDVDADFPLTLVNHPSEFVYTEPWYYGLNRKMAYAQIFRTLDRIWFAQSPTGGGAMNPAWDFQWFIPDYKVDRAYGFTMRAVYLPFESHEQVARETGRHVSALNGRGQR